MTAKKIPELKFKYCPFCFTELVFSNDIGAYACNNPTCCTEVWHNPLDRAQPVASDKGNEYICRSMVGSVDPGGSSSGKKYGGKEKMKKRTTRQIYESLCEK